MRRDSSVNADVETGFTRGWAAMAVEFVVCELIECKN